MDVPETSVLMIRMDKVHCMCKFSSAIYQYITECTAHARVTTGRTDLPDIRRNAQGAADCWLKSILDATSCQSEPDAGLEYAVRRARRSCEFGSLQHVFPCIVISSICSVEARDSPSAGSRSVCLQADFPSADSPVHVGHEAFGVLGGSRHHGCGAGAGHGHELR